MSKADLLKELLDPLPSVMLCQQNLTLRKVEKEEASYLLGNLFGLHRPYSSSASDPVTLGLSPSISAARFVL